MLFLFKRKESKFYGKLILSKRIIIVGLWCRYEYGVECDDSETHFFKLEAYEF